MILTISDRTSSRTLRAAYWLVVWTLLLPLVELLSLFSRAIRGGLFSMPGATFLL